MCHLPWQMHHYTVFGRSRSCCLHALKDTGVGGMCASIYNAMPLQGVMTLVELGEFSRKMNMKV